jgi:dihydrofolate reductase
MQSRISIIVAMARNRVIGVANQLPWRLPADLKHFRSLTMGHHIVMGRKTYQSIGRPLPGRTMVIVSRNPAYTAPGCIVSASIDQALALAAGDNEVFVIGGAQLYQQALGRARRICLTEVAADIAGDVFFPELDLTQWREVDRTLHPADSENRYSCAFVTYDRQL